jgi:hypothetical protein
MKEEPVPYIFDGHFCYFTFCWTKMPLKYKELELERIRIPAMLLCRSGSSATTGESCLADEAGGERGKKKNLFSFEKSETGHEISVLQNHFWNIYAVNNAKMLEKYITQNSKQM